MKRVCLLLVCAIAVFTEQAALAQRAMTVEQLRGFIKSSVEARLDDKSIAEQLKKTRLTEKLDGNTVSELMSLGAGVRTSAALRELVSASANLPTPAATASPAPATAKPKPVMLDVPDSEARETILDSVRDYALGYTQNLPNFICMQVTRREEDRTGTGKNFRPVDKLQEQLTYYEHQEKYKVLAVNNQMVENRDHQKLGGAISEGEFGSMMGEIFQPSSAAEFQWEKFGKLDGVIMNVFSYRISQDRSHYNITVGDGQHVISGYHGLIYARKDNNAVAKITLECDTIPRSFPVQEVKIDLVYDTYKIADREFVLPKNWEMHARDQHGLQHNSAEFSLYRKYETGATITFQTDDDADKPPKPPVKKP